MCLDAAAAGVRRGPRTGPLFSMDLGMGILLRGGCGWCSGVVGGACVKSIKRNRELFCTRIDWETDHFRTQVFFNTCFHINSGYCVSGYRLSGTRYLGEIFFKSETFFALK